MYIRRKVFSLLQDETGEERFFSTTDITLEDAEQRIFSKKEEEDEGSEDKKEKKRKVYLEDVNSNRGLGRSIILGAGPGGAIGGYIGKKSADKADREGKSDKEIKEIAGKSGAKYGAIAGAGLGLANSVRRAATASKGNVGRALLYGLGDTAVLGGLGALGGHFGAKKNTSRRLEKRAAKEREQNDK